MTFWLEDEERDKDRLYITLIDQQSSPHFHWALVLSPKKDIPGEPNGTIYHATNTGTHGKWRYECAPYDPNMGGIVIAKILVTKVIKGQHDWMHEELECLPVGIYGDGAWNDVSWMKEAVEHLREGFADIRPWHELESAALEFGNASRKRYMEGKGGGVGNEAPIKDLRARG